MTERVVRFGLLVCLVLAGHPTFHASAVESGGRAVAFAGATRSGKSTLAALACGLGAALVTDSVLRVGRQGSCFAGPGELRLRPPADSLGAGPAVLESGPCPDGRLAVRYRRVGAEEVDLAAIVVPVLDARVADLDMELLRGARSAAALVAHMRHWFCQDRVLVELHMRQLAAVAEKVPVWRCAVPVSPPLHPGYVDTLLRRVGLAL